MAAMLAATCVRPSLDVAPPGRQQASAARRPLDDKPDLADQPEAGLPFGTWTELRLLHASGIADGQSHTWSHSMVFSEDRLVGFVAPGYADTLPLNRPLISNVGLPEWAQPTALGTPIYAHRSRMSDCLRFFPDPACIERCRAGGGADGGRAFFALPTGARGGTGGGWQWVKPGGGERRWGPVGVAAMAGWPPARTVSIRAAFEERALRVSARRAVLPACPAVTSGRSVVLEAQPASKGANRRAASRAGVRRISPQSEGGCITVATLDDWLVWRLPATPGVTQDTRGRRQCCW